MRDKLLQSATTGPIQRQADPPVCLEGLEHPRTQSPRTLLTPQSLSCSLVCFVPLLLRIHSDSLPMLCLFWEMAQMGFGKLHNATSVSSFETVLNVL